MADGTIRVNFRGICQVGKFRRLEIQRGSGGVSDPALTIVGNSPRAFPSVVPAENLGKNIAAP